MVSTDNLQTIAQALTTAFNADTSLQAIGTSISNPVTLPWCSEVLSESRNSSGSVTAQFFRSGQTISGTGYSYTIDFLGSIREMTNSSGTIQSQVTYDPYGRVTTLSGSLSSDFQYASYYDHGRSGLNIAPYRFYSSTLGRWLNRDPIGEQAGPNLFDFVDNNPVANWDPFGTDVCILTAPKGFSGSHFGHTAVMVGNDSDGWNFYSKSMVGFGGRVGGRGRAVTYPTLPDAAKDPNLKRYKCINCFKTTPEQDDLMRDWAAKHLGNPYFPFFFNCVNFSLGVAAAGGVGVNPQGPLLPNPTQNTVAPLSDYGGSFAP